MMCESQYGTERVKVKLMSRSCHTGLVAIY